jgi:16S rRNA (cytosine967-C5)-methyltransferase
VVSPARRVAFEILKAVEEGGYASDLLHARTRRLDSRDAGLAGEIVFGVLRFQSQIDFLTGHFAGRPLVLSTGVRIALRMGVYQLRFLDRIPPHAAVTESVEQAKQGDPRASGLVNAILRKVHRRPFRWPHRDVELSHPEWLLARWDRQYGPELTRTIALDNLKQPETFVRTSLPSDGLYPTDVAGCYRCEGSVPAGARIQDIGSQMIVPLLGLEPGMRFLDLCAAPGNKTAHALEYSVEAVACDLHHKRLLPLRSLNIPLVELDATSPLPFGAAFDRILVDAPCSGTGTLARNPEIKWRLKPEDIVDLQKRQRAIVRNALTCLKPGGRVVYATCSLEPEENEEVAGKKGDLVRLPGRDTGDGFFAAVLE